MSILAQRVDLHGWSANVMHCACGPDPLADPAEGLEATPIEHAADDLQEVTLASSSS